MSNKVLVISGIIALLCCACAQPNRDCLDIRATNFAVDADEACSGCCIYPQLRLDLLHKFQIGDSLYNFVPSTGIYADGAGNAFRFKDIRFYISELRLLRSDGAEVTLDGRLTLRKAVAGSDSLKVEVEDNFMLATPASLGRIVVGAFRDGGTITGVKFKVGIDEPARSADPASAPAAHPLRVQSVPMWTEAQGYLAQRMEIIVGTAPSDTIPKVFEFGGINSVQSIALNLAQPFSVPPGFNIALTLRIDYSWWFRNVNLVTDPSGEMFRKIADNLPNSFTVTSITASVN
jgi:hypothetical protein